MDIGLIIGAYILSLSLIVLGGFLGVFVYAWDTWGSAMGQISSTFVLKYYPWIGGCIGIISIIVMIGFSGYFSVHKAHLIMMGGALGGVLSYPFWIVMIGGLIASRKKK